jgi:hypothetical protein
VHVRPSGPGQELREQRVHHVHVRSYSGGTRPGGTVKYLDRRRLEGDRAYMGDQFFENILRIRLLNRTHRNEGSKYGQEEIVQSGQYCKGGTGNIA